LALQIGLEPGRDRREDNAIGNQGILIKPSKRSADQKNGNRRPVFFSAGYNEVVQSDARAASLEYSFITTSVVTTQLTCRHEITSKDPARFLEAQALLANRKTNRPC